VIERITSPEKPFSDKTLEPSSEPRRSNSLRTAFSSENDDKNKNDVLKERKKDENKTDRDQRKREEYRRKKEERDRKRAKRREELTPKVRIPR
jgi:hypothetical protein